MRQQAAGRGGGGGSNKMQLVREKIDDVVVRAPAPAKATVGHSHTYILVATLSHTHAHLCAPWTQKSFASLKSLALSLLLLSPALSVSLLLYSLIFFYGVYFWRFVASPESPESIHPSRLASIITGLSPRPRPHTRPHIILVCVCVSVWGLSYDLKDIGYRIGVWIMNSS